MKKFITIYSIALSLVMLLAVIHFKRYCDSMKKEVTPHYKLIKKEVHDTIIIHEPQPAETVFVPVPADVDTSEILENYFANLIYVDTIHANEYVDIRIVDSVSQNKLQSHFVEILSLPDVYVPPNAGSSRCLALGGLAGFNVAILKADYSLNRHTMSVGYDFRNKTPVFGYSFKIFSWK